MANQSKRCQCRVINASTSLHCIASNTIFVNTYSLGQYFASLPAVTDPQGGIPRKTCSLIYIDSGLATPRNLGFGQERGIS